MTVFTYPLDIPATVPNPRAVTLRRRSNAAVDINDFTFDQTVYRWPGEAWEIAITWSPMDRPAAEDLLAVFFKLDGPKGWVRLGDHTAATPRGIATGTPRVNGANQSGNDLITDGWTAGQTGILKTGDYIQLEDRLYKVLADANSDGSGNATFNIWPRLRSAPADNALLTVTAAKGIFRLPDNLQEWTVNDAILYDMNCNFIEKLP